MPEHSLRAELADIQHKCLVEKQSIGFPPIHNVHFQETVWHCLASLSERIDKIEELLEDKPKSRSYIPNALTYNPKKKGHSKKSE